MGVEEKVILMFDKLVSRISEIDENVHDIYIPSSVDDDQKISLITDIMNECKLRFITYLEEENNG